MDTAYLIHLLAFVMKRKPTVLLGPILPVLETVVDFERNFLLASDLLCFECIELVLLDEEESRVFGLRSYKSKKNECD